MGTHVERVVVFGSSTAHGMGATNHYGWAQMLERRYYELNADLDIGSHGQLASSFYNQAIPGLRSVDLAPWAGQALTSRALDHRSELLPPDKVLSVVSLGGNDAWVRHSDGKTKVSEGDFSTHMTTIAQTLAARSRVLFVGPPSIDETKNSVFHGLPTRPQFESFQQYEATAADIFRKVGGRAVELVTCTQYEIDYFDHIREDGAHPDDKGHTWIYHQVCPWFDAMVSIPMQPAVWAADCEPAGTSSSIQI